MINEETRREYRKRKARASLEGAQNLKARDIRCPTCGHKILVAYDDCVGHVTMYCNKCHQIQNIDFKLFRLEKKK